MRRKLQNWSHIDFFSELNSTRRIKMSSELEIWTNMGSWESRAHACKYLWANTQHNTEELLKTQCTWTCVFERNLLNQSTECMSQSQESCVGKMDSGSSTALNGVCHRPEVIPHHNRDHWHCVQSRYVVIYLSAIPTSNSSTASIGLAQ